MSDRYSWATSGVQGRGGRAAERMDWTLGRALAPEGAPLPPGDGAAPVGGGGGGAGAGAWPRPTGSDALWQSVGPTATVRGAVDSDVRVAGRVNGIAVSPDGTRAYAVSALGGLWYSENGGISWEPIGAWRTSDQATLRASSHTLSGGAVHVYWGVDAGDDEVWLGTGEPVPATSRDRGYVGAYGGVGILHKTGPVVAARQNRLADPWDAPPQAIDRLAAAGAPAYAGLRGQGVFAFANDPATADLDAPRRLLAATTAGLHRHDPLAAAGTEWSLVPVAAWEALRPGISARAFVTDVAWLPATARHAARVWVCVVDKTVAGLTGLWVGTGGGPLAKVALPGLPALPAGKMRLTLAAHPNHPDLLYVLGSGPSLWRIDGAPAVPPAPAPPAAPVAVSVASLPAQLFGSPGDQSEWDCSAAIDPNNSARVMIGGAAVRSRLLGIAGATIGAWAAALYQLTVTPTPGGAPGTFTSNYVAGESADPAWVGSEVHADVHAITWLRTPGGPQHVWVGCDGGVFRSEQDGVIGSFEARSAGMSVAEPGFVANNPLSPGPVLAGMQDNGPQLRIGEGVWRQASPHGDGGGVAFDPGTPGRFVVQATQSRWEDDIRTRVDPQRRGTGAAGDGSNYDLENRQTSFYANAAVIAQGGAGAAAATRLALGTDRVWFSTQWGVVGSWVTLPTTTDPRAADNPAPAALVQDRLLPTGASPWGSTAIAPGIRALRWQTPLRLLAVTRGTVHALTDPGAPGAWGRTPVATRQAVPGGGVPAAVPAPAPIAGALPGFGEYNDLAVHDPVAGSFYLATSHPLEPLWWWDGARCHPTGLGSMAGGTRSPAYSVVTDLVTPTTATVYVGTTSGVWQGEFTAPAAAGSPGLALAAVLQRPAGGRGAGSRDRLLAATGRRVPGAPAARGAAGTRRLRGRPRRAVLRAHLPARASLRHTAHPARAARRPDGGRLQTASDVGPGLGLRAQSRSPRRGRQPARAPRWHRHHGHALARQPGHRLPARSGHAACGRRTASDRRSGDAAVARRARRSLLAVVAADGDPRAAGRPRTRRRARHPRRPLDGLVDRAPAPHPHLARARQRPATGSGDRRRGALERPARAGRLLGHALERHPR